MGSERPAQAEVGRPEFLTVQPAGRSDGTGPELSRLGTSMAIGMICLLGFLLMANEGMSVGDPEPQIPIPSPSPSPSATPSPSPSSKGGTGTTSGRTPLGPITPFAGSGPRVITQYDGPILDVSIGAIAISTDFDGRITALELDSGVLTRTSIRTGAFVTVDGKLVVQTGCGAWQFVEIPEYRLGDNLIECGSYQPIGRRGADVVFFASPGPNNAGQALMADGHGGVFAATVPEVAALANATVSDGRVLIQAADSELVWIQTSNGESTPYADGRLIESGPGGVLWADCETSTGCDVWFGTPEQARVNRFEIESREAELQARINNGGSRAAFFLENDVLRIVALETGHARDLENPGIGWSTATWSPDGRWLLDPMGTEVVALNTVDGTTIRFQGVPGDVSPGWVALIEDSQR